MTNQSKKNNEGIRTVLLTGAAGCVGTYIVELLLARGDRVVATDRPGTSLPKGPSDRLTVIPGDLTDPDFPRRLVANVTDVIHTAAVVDITRSIETLRPINVDAVARLYEAAAAQGVATFIHFGTGSIYQPQNRPIREDDPLRIQNDYGLSKVMSEELLQGRAGSGPVVNILRPSLIYGPKGKVLLNLFAAFPPFVRLLSPLAPTFSGGPVCNYVHAEDVARAAIFLLDHPQPHGAVFNIANDEPIAAGDMITLTLKAGGLRIVGPAIPLYKPLLRYGRPWVDREFLFRLLNGGIARVWRQLRRRYGLDPDFFPQIPREMLDFLSEDIVFSNEKIKALGFQLNHPTFAPSWQATLRWFVEQHWVPAPPAALPKAA